MRFETKHANGQAFTWVAGCTCDSCEMKRGVFNEAVRAELAATSRVWGRRIAPTPVAPRVLDRWRARASRMLAALLPTRT